MKLSEKDVELSYKLHPGLLSYANRQLKVANRASTIKELIDLRLEEKIQIRDALYDRVDLIDTYHSKGRSYMMAFWLLIACCLQQVFAGV